MNPKTLLVKIILLSLAFHLATSKVFYQSMPIGRSSMRTTPPGKAHSFSIALYGHLGIKYLLERHADQLSWSRIDLEQQETPQAPTGSLLLSTAPVILDNPGYDMVQLTDPSCLITVGEQKGFFRITRLDPLNQDSDLQFSMKAESESQTTPITLVAIVPGKNSSILTGPELQLWDSRTLKLLKRDLAATHFKNIVCLDAITCIGLVSGTGRLLYIDLSSERFELREFETRGGSLYQQIAYFEQTKSLFCLKKTGLIHVYELDNQLEPLEFETSLGGKDRIASLKVLMEEGQYYLLAGGYSNEFWTITLPFKAHLSEITAKKSTLDDNINDPSSMTFCLFLGSSSQIVAIATKSPIVYYFEKKPCHSTCLTCDGETPSDCLSCDKGSYLDQTMSTCEKCLQGCEQCSGATTCDQCHKDYGLISQGSETVSYPCCPKSCLRCSGPEEKDCLERNGDKPNENQVDGNQPESETGTIQRRILPGCGVGQFDVNGDGSSCPPCVTNCDTCESASTCYLCLPNFYVITNTACTPCNAMGPCLTCDGYDCTNCAVGHSLFNGLCDPCTNHSAQCTTCTSSACTACDSGYYVNGSGGCNLCTAIANCVTCLNTGPTCTGCASGYYANGSGGCNLCTAIENCVSCLNTGPTCIGCASGYYVHGSGDCILCSDLPYCVTCLNTGPTCTGCEPYFHVVSGTCQDCGAWPNCTHCASAGGACITCDQANRYYLSGSTCLQCSSSQYSTGIGCTNCPVGCQACTSGTNCTSCKTNFSMSGTLCQCAITNCLTCNQTNAGYCDVCSNSFFSNGATGCSPCNVNCELCNSSTCTQCKPTWIKITPADFDCVCQSPCLTCSGVGQCATCISDHYRNISTSQCLTSCQSPCATCQTTTTYCLTCEATYYLSISNTCVTSCQSPCATCQTTTTHCLTCVLGTYLSGSNCQSSCQGDCATCQTTTTYCLTCTAPGKTAISGVCQNCLSPCATCSTSVTTCTSCVSQQYVMMSTLCITCLPPCLTCQTAPSVCLSCQPNYNFSGGVCTCIASHCSTCNTMNGAVCLVCQPGFYLSGSTCVQCHSLCTACTGAGNTNCTACMTPPLYNTNTCCGSMCIACDGTACITCDASNKYVTGFTCTNCHASCATCANGTSCNTCLPGRYNDGANFCPVCHSSCKECTGPLRTHCTQCHPSQILRTSDNTCCDPTCLTCSDIAANNCLTCSPYKYISGLSCLDCHASCPTCTSGSAIHCTSCVLPRRLSSTAPSPCCDATCFTCSGPEINQCTGCDGGLVLRSNYCCHSSCLTCNAPLINNCTSCPAQHYLSSGSCLPCDAKCLDCATTATNCTSCPVNSVLRTNHCCHSSCSTCSGLLNTNCLSCSGGFILSVDSMCCHDSCLTCNGTLRTHCLSCPATTVYRVSAPSGICCHSSCTDCSGTALNTCLVCENPSITHLVNGICCDLTCVTCSEFGEDKCFTCLVGRSIKAGRCCDNSCLTCNGPLVNQCLTCASGRSPFNGYCCHAKCEECNGPQETNCLSCVPTHHLDSSRCCLNDCTTCSGFLRHQCTGCATGLHPHGDLAVDPPFTTASPFGCCHRECLGCNGPLLNNCSSCHVRRFLSGTTCIDCHSECLSCNGVQNLNCLSCDPGLILRNGYCCTGNCLTCIRTGFDKCLTCIDSRPPFLGICCHQNCQSCTERYSNSCTSCIQGRYLAGTECLPCHIDCENCTGPLRSECTSCIPGRSLDNGYCCHSDCVACRGFGVTMCISCSAGRYFLESSPGPPVEGSCPPCDPNCKTCVTNATNCLSCFPRQNLQLISPTPFSICCHMDCNTCTGTEFNHCSSCVDSKKVVYPNPTGPGLCLPCHQSCLTCRGITEIECNTCPTSVEGVSRLPDPTNLYCCHFSCETCNGWKYNQCLTCPDNFMLRNSECIPCHKNCQTCKDNTDNCTSCKPGLFFVTFNSLTCQTVCLPEYYSFQEDNKLKCARCGSNCRYCIERADKCTECRPPEFLYPDNTCAQCDRDNWFQQSGLLCLPCDSTCLRCNGTSDTSCTKCIDGFSVRNGRCVMNPPLELVRSEFVPDMERVIVYFNSRVNTLLPDISKTSEVYLSSSSAQELESFMNNNNNLNDIPGKITAFNLLQIEFDDDRLRIRIKLKQTLSSANCLVVLKPGQRLYQGPGHYKGFFRGNYVLIQDISKTITGFDESLEASAESGKKGVQFIQTILMIVALPQAFILIKVLQTLDFYIYINVKHPSNFSTFLDMITSSPIDFLPNIFEGLTDDDGEPVYDRFQRFGYKVHIFANLGQMFTIMTILLGFKMIFRLLAKLIPWFKSKFGLK
jgi:hypothetical protein